MIPAALLIEAYRRGIFPMAGADGQIAWYSPDPRAVIPLEDFHIPHGLVRALRKNAFRIEINQSFATVIAACAERAETWINDEIIESYLALHKMGFAHSVETWCGSELTGGLYGVALRGAFFGESMFSRHTDASKIALCALVERMRARGFALLDTQWQTAHLRQFGTIEISRPEYLQQLESALQKDCAFA